MVERWREKELYQDHGLKVYRYDSFILNGDPEKSAQSCIAVALEALRLLVES